MQSTCFLAFFPHLLTYSAELWVSVGALRCSGLLQSLPIALMVLLCHSLAWDESSCAALLSFHWEDVGLVLHQGMRRSFILQRVFSSLQELSPL